MTTSTQNPPRLAAPHAAANTAARESALHLQLDPQLDAWLATLPGARFDHAAQALAARLAALRAAEARDQQRTRLSRERALFQLD